MQFCVVGNHHDHVRLVVNELLRGGATQATAVERIDDVPGIESVQLVVVATRPDRRATTACQAMQAGKDVVVLKPAAIDSRQLRAIASTQQETGRMFSVFYSEHFLNPAVQLGLQMCRDGAIGPVRCVDGLGPHRLRPQTRPSWFFDDQKAGGILADLASHQMQHFIDFANVDYAEVICGQVSRGIDSRPTLQSAGIAAVASGRVVGNFRVDWLSPDGLPTWGDGRLFVVGESGFMEIRKTIDLAGLEGEAHLLVTDASRTQRYACDGRSVRFGAELLNDVLNRSERSNTVKRALLATALAIDAQNRASGTADADASCAQYVAQRDFTVN